MQEQLRRLKKTKEKQDEYKKRILQGEAIPNDMLTGGITCTACGMAGHMKTNRVCPFFDEGKQQR